MLFNLLFSMRYKNWCCGAKETAQRLSVLIALSEDPTLVSSPSVGLLKTTCNFSTGGTSTYFWALQVSRRTAYNHKDIHIDTHIKNFKKKPLIAVVYKRELGPCSYFQLHLHRSRSRRRMPSAGGLLLLPRTQRLYTQNRRA